MPSAIDISAQSGSNRYVAAMPALVFFAFLFAFVVHAGFGLLEADRPFDLVEASAKKVYGRFWVQLFSNPLVIFGVPLIFALQIILPARKNEPALGPATRVDLVFSLGMLVFVALIAPAFFAFTRLVYDNSLAPFTADLTVQAAQLPTWLQFLIGYLAVDFLGWVHHFVRHRVAAFWEFHAVHHAQRNMNPFTNERVHPLDWLSSNTIKFLPMYLFTDSLGIALNYIVIHSLLDRLNHSNVRTNLGWLRYIFVTPQSHRIHHSREPEHQNMNFGVSLSIWDHLFGTQYRNYDEYPATGVADPGYPVETDGSAMGVMATLWREFLYPFRRSMRPLGPGAGKPLPDFRQ